MTSDDIVAFTGALTELAGVYAEPIDQSRVSTYFRVLSDLSLEAVLTAMDDAARTCRFFPKPVEIRERVASTTGHLGPEQAWALVSHLTDEGPTIVWTEEIGRAWSVARFLMAEGDMVAARMAFLEAYRRELVDVTEAPRWIVVLGWDVPGRPGPIAEAVRDGRLELSEGQSYLRPEQWHMLPSPTPTQIQRRRA